MFRLRPDAAFTLKSETSPTKMLDWHEPGPPPPLALDFIPDVPGPVICVGNQHDSGGAIFSGYIRLKVFKESTLSKLSVHVSLTEKFSDPPIHGCKDCSSKTVTIHDAEVLDHGSAHIVEQGLHDYPISFHIPGNLPATYIDKHRQVEYHLSLRADITSSPSPVHFTTPFTVARFCPREATSRRLRGYSPCFVMDMVIPAFSSRNEKFDIQIELRTRDAYSHPPRAFWEPRTITWEIIECVQELRLPCPQHSDLFKEARCRPLKETRTEIFGDELNLLHQGRTEMEILSAGTKRFTLPAHIRRTVTNDVTTIKEFKVWHEVKIKVLYMYTKPLPPEDKSDKEVTGTWDVRCFGLGAKLCIGEKHALQEMESWDEEIAPAYANIGLAPPSYQG
ncbi:hypothetical protein DRE_00427 [Drechslerella stenobrocha 248]|uniref:LDB19 N-terminal domain-containing protein n=1 Tax=Drechslerella stenobrocha 248 TaxID=1043628 RepID=W7HVD4_9PEZI|nr:hypothetical protein DRE_00427 [Drechslerella stenobrocha 248]